MKKEVTEFYCDRCNELADKMSDLYELKTLEIGQTGWPGGDFHLCSVCWGQFTSLFLHNHRWQT